MYTGDELNMRSPSEYSCLNQVLQDVNGAVIRINRSSKKVAVDRAMKVVYRIVNYLAQDETFNKVYNGIRHVGSYYDGLRVTEATEFDINIVLKFPFHKKCKVQRSTVAGFVQVRIEEDNPSWFFGGTRYSMDQTLKKIVDSDGYIGRDQVLQWWQSIFSRHVTKNEDLYFDGVHCKVTWRTSGPAITVRMKFDDSQEIDVDLVPVLMFQDGDSYSPPVYKRWIKQNQEPKQWYIVPKPLRDNQNNRLWRLSYTDQEKVIMDGLEHLKPTNKLMKRLRDNFAWKKLSSYFIKNVFLCEAEKKKASGDAKFFQNNLGYLFVYFLNVIKLHLQCNSLPFFWDPDMNLFQQIPQETAYNHYRCLERISSKIHRLLDEKKRTELNEYIRSLLIGGHSVCVENSISNGPSYRNSYPARPVTRHSYDEHHIFRDNCNRCRKAQEKLSSYNQSWCVIL